MNNTIKDIINSYVELSNYSTGLLDIKRNATEINKCRIIIDEMMSLHDKVDKTNNLIYYDANTNYDIDAIHNIQEYTNILKTLYAQVLSIVKPNKNYVSEYRLVSPSYRSSYLNYMDMKDVIDQDGKIIESTFTKIHQRSKSIDSRYRYKM